MIVLDDVGFAQLGCYGSDISTPTLDGIANNGVRLTNFHTTALCSPTRSCLLTGRNHHRNGMARIADLAVGYPGYCGRIPRENGFLSETLRANGYATYAVGKWHLTPDDETNMAASRSSWPLARGFDRWYGFHGGETHQFVPSLYHDNHSVPPPARPEDGYHLSADLADRAIGFIGDLRAVDADRPFFCYFATGACHSPHHAPPEWIERYRGQFDRGWDEWRETTFARQIATGVLPAHTQLSPRPHWVPAWDSLKAEDQAVAARFMECFAAFLSYTDAQIARLLAFLERTGDLDNTVIVVVSDNGASAEGGPKGSINDGRLMNGAPAGRRELRARIDEIGGPTAHNNYPWGWTMAGNTPFKRWKREVHEGGVADPCIISAPGLNDGGGTRRQFAHAIDVLPTILDLVGIAAPVEIDGVEQSRIDGQSFASALRDANAPETHETQHFEMLGSRGIYHRGWKAVTFHPLGAMYDDGLDPDAPFDDDVWELYDVQADPSETNDLAAAEPERLAADDRSLVGGGREQRRIAARQPSTLRDPEPAPDEPPGARHVRVLPGGFAGSGVGRSQRAQSFAHHHRVDHRAGRRGRRGHAARARLGARRFHVADPRRPAPVRAQPLRRAAGRDRRRRGADAGPARGRVRLHEDGRVHRTGRVAHRRRGGRRGRHRRTSRR